MNPLVEKLIDPDIRALKAYHVADASGMIKLDAMENPYLWPQRMVDDWLAQLRHCEVNRYPDPSARALSARLRDYMQVPSDAEVMLGNGSDELIQIVAMAVAGSADAQPRVLMAPEPGFVMYQMIAKFVGMRFHGVALSNDDFSLDLDAMLSAIAQTRPALIFLAYPNNPTGNLFDRDAIEAILAAAPGLVVIDEAYHAFAEASFMDQVGRHPNLLVMRTVSKLGLAGLRLGLLAGPRDWIDEFDKLRLPYNINVLTQATASFALERAALLDQQSAQIRADRSELISALADRDGLQVFPSAANFVLFRTPPGRATAIFDALKQGGVLIKNLSPTGGMLADCLRVTVGTPEENHAFLAALDAALKP